MALVYRTAGAWGAGVGRPLTREEIDGNFRHIDQRLSAVTRRRPVLPESSTFDNRFTVTIVMEDASEHVIEMPYTALFFTGEWQGSYEYSYLDTFSVGGNQYIVLTNHISAVSFSASAISSSGAALYRRIALATNPNLLVENYNDWESSTYDVTISPTIDDNRKTFSFDYYTDNPIFSLPADATLDFPIGTKFVLVNWGDLDVEVIYPTAVTINGKPSTNYKTSGPSTSMTLIKIAADEWDLIGDQGIVP